MDGVGGGCRWSNSGHGGGGGINMVVEGRMVGRVKEITFVHYDAPDVCQVVRDSSRPNRVGQGTNVRRGE